MKSWFSDVDNDKLLRYGPVNSTTPFFRSVKSPPISEQCAHSRAYHELAF